MQAAMLQSNKDNSESCQYSGEGGGGRDGGSFARRQVPARGNSRTNRKRPDGSDSGSPSRVPMIVPSQTDEVVTEVDKLKKEKFKAIYEIERYKKLITYAIVFSLFSLLIAIFMVVWRFTSDEPSFEEVRRKIIQTPDEDPRLCVTVFPNAIERNFTGDDDVGEPLIVTELIEQGRIEEAVERSQVENIMQSEKSYSGFITVNKASGSNLFFWYFPSVSSLKEQEKSSSARNESIPLVLWLQGGPGWPTMYGLFKENGPFLCGFDVAGNSAYLVENKFSWTKDHHLLYIDNPVGTGFSFTDVPDGYPKTDDQVAMSLIEALRQFLLMFPYMTRGQSVSETPFFAFGESYGGAYVVSLAKHFIDLKKRRNQKNQDIIRDELKFKGIGIGNGFISSVDQSLYADYVRSLGFLTDKEINKFEQLDANVVDAYRSGRYSDVILYSQESLHFFTSTVLNLTNIYDYTFDGNYLTNHEYVCFLQQEHVRRGIHVGAKEFNKGYDSYTYLNQSIAISKKSWINDILDDGTIEVLIYNGNLDVIVNVIGMNRVVKSLSWNKKHEFDQTEREIYWVYNEDNEQGEMAGYFHEGGGLTYMIVRNAGHMVPISQPRWALQIVYDFTHKASKSQGGDRFQRPQEIKRAKFASAFQDCSLE